MTVKRITDPTVEDLKRIISDLSKEAGRAAGTEE